MSNRAEEIALYVGHYQNPEYRMGARRAADVQRILRTLPSGSLLDVATGRGETLVYARDAGHGPTMGTEVVPDLLGASVVYAEAHKLPFDDGSWDHVTCFDCLEHLVEEDIRPALAEMRRIARRSVTVSASEVPSVYDGRDLHISKRPQAAWLALIAGVWGKDTRDIGTAGRSPAFQILIPDGA